jgi:hypothetical protein
MALRCGLRRHGELIGGNAKEWRFATAAVMNCFNGAVSNRPSLRQSDGASRLTTAANQTSGFDNQNSFTFSNFPIRRLILVISLG